MNRRSFFKVVGAVGGAMALPSAVTKLIPATQALPNGVVELGLIRELIQYDFYRDAKIVSYDVLAKNKNIQLAITFMLEPHQNIEDIRKEAKTLLEKAMVKDGLKWSDIVPMPNPPGYERLIA